MPRPVFVVTGPRSGSTLVVALLDSHPRIAMTNEAAWVTFLRKAFLLASTPSSQAIDDGEGFATPGILPERYTENFAYSFLTTLRPFVTDFYRRVGGGDCDLFGDKILSCNDLAFAIRHFPEAAFVQLVRDPRDVIASTFAHQKVNPASWLESAFATRVDHMERFLRETHGMLAGKDSFFLRYEDLITDLEGKTAAMLAALGLEVTDEVRAYQRDAAGKLFRSHGTSESPAASVGRWRTDFTAEQQAMAADRLGDQLRRLGYEV
ncbi:MAG: sulfotransferase [Planctomycetes bacterium]|nr:sulfotransferase [Planctomycetota bacterium]